MDTYLIWMALMALWFGLGFVIFVIQLHIVSEIYL